MIKYLNSSKKPVLSDRLQHSSRKVRFKFAWSSISVGSPTSTNEGLKGFHLIYSQEIVAIVFRSYSFKNYNK